MTVWYVHREGDAISYAGEFQEGYAEEALDDASNSEIQAFFAAAHAPVSILKRKQIMVQLAADGKLDAAFAAAQQAGGLIYQRWFSDDWALSDLQTQPFASMISALNIDLPTFWVAAAQQPV